MTKSWDEALERMTDTEAELSADGVVSVRFETLEITQGAAEILC